MPEAETNIKTNMLEPSPQSIKNSVSRVQNPGETLAANTLRQTLLASKIPEICGCVSVCIRVNIGKHLSPKFVLNTAKTRPPLSHPSLSASYVCYGKYKTGEL